MYCDILMIGKSIQAQLKSLQKETRIVFNVELQTIISPILYRIHRVDKLWGWIFFSMPITLEGKALMFLYNWICQIDQDEQKMFC